MRIVRFGDVGTYVEVDRASPADDARRARALARALRDRASEVEVIAGGAAVVAATIWTVSEVEACAALSAIPSNTPSGTLHTIELVYDGPDLPEVAAATGLSVLEVIERHASREVEVEVMGFLPGFGYLAELDEALRLPRLASPRKAVAAGSVGIAGRFTGIYPFASPGGWNLVARAVDPALFDPERADPMRFHAGDRVRFVPVDVGASASPDLLHAGLAKPRPSRSGTALEVTRCGPHLSIQDLGRTMRSVGIPAGGALDEVSHRAANRAVGNADTDATVELLVDGAAFTALRDVWFSVDGEPAMKAVTGDRIDVPRGPRLARYLALRGGIAVPRVLGSRSTLAVAALGGLDGRRLMRGDRLDVGADPGSAIPPGGHVVDLSLPEVVDAFVGPHADRFSEDALDRFFETTWTVSPLLDRVGARLEGRAVPRAGADAAVPEPMWRGAVQVTSDGVPIVLGPDSAVTGGYPIAAVVARSAVPGFSRLRPGALFRFARKG